MQTINALAATGHDVQRAGMSFAQYTSGKVANFLASRADATPHQNPAYLGKMIAILRQASRNPAVLAAAERAQALLESHTAAKAAPKGQFQLFGMMLPSARANSVPAAAAQGANWAPPAPQQPSGLQLQASQPPLQAHVPVPVHHQPQHPSSQPFPQAQAGQAAPHGWAPQFAPRPHSGQPALRAAPQAWGAPPGPAAQHAQAQFAPQPQGAQLIPQAWNMQQAPPMQPQPLHGWQPLPQMQNLQIAPGANEGQPPPHMQGGQPP
jgi:hypothetical protein